MDEPEMSERGMYLSFVGEEGFRGGVFIPRAKDIIEAVEEAWRLGINPGGEVAALGPGPMPPSEWVAILLSREDLVALDRVMGRA
jgi:hypothetical protein